MISTEQNKSKNSDSEILSGKDDDVWFQPTFRRFWNQYFLSRDWMRKHQMVSDLLRSNYQPQFPVIPPPPPPPPVHCCHHRHPVIETTEHEVQAQSTTFVEENADGDVEMNVAEEEDSEINEDFVEFLSISIKHRMERDKEKNRITNEHGTWVGALDEYVPVDKIGVNRRQVEFAESLLPPTEDQSCQRAREMKLLYGANAERIQALESLMQVQFDLDFDRLNPPLWPNMPFKL